MDSILLLLEDRGNANLLAELLATRHRVAVGPPQGLPRFDLCICDGAGLHRYQRQLRRAKTAAAPVFLPVLLLTPAGQTGAHRWWEQFDDMIRRPLEKTELLTRVEMLLRTRRLSLALQASTEALRHARDQLEERVAARTHQLAEANARLRAEINARSAAEELLRLHAQVFDSNAEAVVILDAQHRIVTVNRAFSRMTGYRPAEVGGADAALICEHAATGFLATLWRAIAEEDAWQGEITCRRKNAEAFPAWLSASAVRDPDGELTHFIILLSDLAERKRTESRLDFLSNYDYLTGLPNLALLRTHFDRQLATAAGKQRPSVLVVDMDGFKFVNDSLGHPLGDRLLRRLGRRLQRCIGRCGIVSRQGGDQFIVLLDAGTSADAARLAERVLEALRRPSRIRGHELSLTASIGISLYPVDGSDLDTLLKNADAALHHAKAAGHDSYQFFRREMNRRAVRRLTLEHQLRRALEREEFELHFQPQMEIVGGRLSGAESLLRWRHPRRGLLAPGQFIGIAEDAGLIPAIGEWTLWQTCHQARQWQRDGYRPPPLAVNLSALQFRQRNVPRLVRRALSSTGVAPAALELELTESVLMEHAQAALTSLHELKELGVRLALDDFGTGYSSLSYLKRLPLYKLKIDQSFVHDLASNPDDAAIVDAIISLARSLGLRVLAEGVEEAEQLSFLRSHRCDEIQGFLYSRPLSAAAFRSFLAARRGNGDRARPEGGQPPRRSSSSH